jgi:hypothetical protein
MNDPKPVFDALDAYIAGTAYTVSNASVTLDGSAATHTVTCQDRQQNSFTYSERNAGVRVTVSPLTASLTAAQTQQFTATATNPDGSTVSPATFTWSLAPGALGTVDANGLYTAPATITTGVSDALTATLSGQQAWATVYITLQASVVKRS